MSDQEFTDGKGAAWDKMVALVTEIVRRLDGERFDKSQWKVFSIGDDINGGNYIGSLGNLGSPVRKRTITIVLEEDAD